RDRCRRHSCGWSWCCRNWCCWNWRGRNRRQMRPIVMTRRLTGHQAHENPFADTAIGDPELADRPLPADRRQDGAAAHHQVAAIEADTGHLRALGAILAGEAI